MLVVLVTVINVYSLSEAQLEPVISTLLFGFALLISSIVVWCWHLLLSKHLKLQLTIALPDVISVSDWLNTSLGVVRGSRVLETFR